MSKQEIIEQIRRHNPSARPEFLAGFLEYELAAYLRQLIEIQQDRQRREQAELALAG